MVLGGGGHCPINPPMAKVINLVIHQSILYALNIFRFNSNKN